MNSVSRLTIVSSESYTTVPSSIQTELQWPACCDCQRLMGRRETLQVLRDNGEGPWDEEAAHIEDTGRAGLSEIVQVSQAPSSRGHMIRRRCPFNFARLAGLARCPLVALPHCYSILSASVLLIRHRPSFLHPPYDRLLCFSRFVTTQTPCQYLSQLSPPCPTTSAGS